MIDRRQVLAMAVVGFGTLPTDALGQQKAAPQKVGFVALATRDEEQIEGFEMGLREQGLEPGVSVQVEFRFGDGTQDGLRKSIAALLADGVRVFVTGGPNIARQIHEQFPGAAIVVASLESLPAAGITGSIARPVGNVTGFATLGAELIEKRMDLLRELIPGLRRIAVVTNPANSVHSHFSESATLAGSRMNLGVKIVAVAGKEQLKMALERAKAEGTEAALFMRDFMFESMRSILVDAALATGMPSIFDEGAYVRIGGLMSYGPNRPDLFRRSAAYVAKILKGAKPADLPVQQPTKFELLINAKTAKALGLTIPPTLLAFATEVIE
jgi:putative tryptophan/tyrosine transport system substrate-binding protein